MAAAVQVRGLREVRNAARKVDKDIPKGLRQELLPVARSVQRRVQSKVPYLKGDARSSVKARASQRGAAIAFGGARAEYFPWLDFGGSTGKGHRPGVADSGSVKRPWMKPPFPEGRYVYPSINELTPEIEEAANDAVMNLARAAGFEVR